MRMSLDLALASTHDFYLKNVTGSKIRRTERAQRRDSR